MKLKTADTHFSRWIRNRDSNEYGCCKCPLCDYYGMLETFVNGHYIGRAIKSTRWHPDNCFALCFNCNRDMENDQSLKDRYGLWILEKIGSDRWSELMAIRLNSEPWSQRMIDLIADKYK